jgi:hypothetical protein
LAATDFPNLAHLLAFFFRFGEPVNGDGVDRVRSLAILCKVCRNVARAPNGTLCRRRSVNVVEAARQKPLEPSFQSIHSEFSRGGTRIAIG